MSLYSIKIIHDELVGKSYRLLTDFYRLAGIFVQGRTPKTDTTETKYDVAFIIKDGIAASSVELLQQIYPDAILLDEIPLDSSTEERKEYIRSTIDKLMQKDFLLSSEENEFLQDMAGIYIDYDLMYHRIAFTFATSFLQSQNAVLDAYNVIEKAQIAYADALIHLRQCMKAKGNASKFYRYAEVYMGKIINETCELLDECLVFDTKKCVAVLDSLLAQDLRFKNVYALKALFAEIDRRFFYDAKHYFKIVAANDDGQAYMSYPVYRAGRFFERRMLDKQTAAEFYKKSLELNSYEYRALYKKNSDFEREK